MINDNKNLEDFFLSIGYTKEEVIKMTKVQPNIYGYTIDNLKQRVDLFDTIGFHDLPVIDPIRLMTSAALVYARYSFYKDNGITIDMNNYKKLFIGNEKFKKQYGISKEELLNMYNYEEYLKKKENGRTK